MDVVKITEKDLEGKGVIGQPAVPGLSVTEMQRKFEEIVRDVAIVKINELIDWLAENGATLQDLSNLAIEAGAVTSVFGRRGAVVAKEGDYTPEQVGAAAKVHGHTHALNGSDPIDPAETGLAAAVHSHGNITFDGKIGTTNGKLVMTGINGTLEAVDKSVLLNYLIAELPFYDGEVI